MTDNPKPIRPGVGFYTFTCCEGCQFTMLFIKDIMALLEKFEIPYFNLLKEKNSNVDLDLAFIEGAITTTMEIQELKEIRNRAKVVVAMGACACYGGVPAMRNFVESSALRKYVYYDAERPDAVPVAGIGNYIEVDYYMRGCPIIKTEFVNFMQSFLQEKIMEPYQGSVCTQCPRGPSCFLRSKVECLGAVTHGGCGALCPSENIPCMLCRGPTDKLNIAKEIKLFEKFGLEEKEIHNRLNRFKNLGTSQ